LTHSVSALGTESFLSDEENPPKDYITIGTFANMNAMAWKKDEGLDCSKHDKDSLELINCNLQVYGGAIETAAAEKVDLLVFPEGYSTIGSPQSDGFYDSIPE
jgi:hypothetical protein